MNKFKWLFSKFAPSFLLTFFLILSVFHYKAFIIFCILILLIFSIESIRFICKFKGEIHIKTPEGSDQPYHPSVLYFKDGWNGYKYWMSYTPMPLNKPPYTDRWECPCVVCSNDGKTWNYPNKIEVLDDLTDEQITNKDFFSDPHLTYNSKDNCIYLYYRISEGNKQWKDISLLLIKSVDGINWSKKEKLNYIDENIINNRPISPSFICIDNSSYFMWYVEGGAKQKRNIYFSNSNNGIDWNNNHTCTLNHDINPWHIDVVKIDNTFYLTVYDLSQKVEIFQSLDGINFTFIKTLLTPSKHLGSFYKLGLYRTCIIKNEDGYSAYFSAKDGFRTAIGLLKGPTLEKMQVVSASKFLKYRRFIRDLTYKYLYLYVWILKKIAK